MHELLAAARRRRRASGGNPRLLTRIQVAVHPCVGSRGILGGHVGRSLRRGDEARGVGQPLEWTVPVSAARRAAATTPHTAALLLLPGSMGCAGAGCCWRRQRELGWQREGWGEACRTSAPGAGARQFDSRQRSGHAERAHRAALDSKSPGRAGGERVCRQTAAGAGLLCPGRHLHPMLERTQAAMGSNRSSLARPLPVLPHMSALPRLQPPAEPALPIQLSEHTSRRMR